MSRAITKKRMKLSNLFPPKLSKKTKRQKVEKTARKSSAPTVLQMLLEQEAGIVRSQMLINTATNSTATKYRRVKTSRSLLLTQARTLVNCKILMTLADEIMKAILVVINTKSLAPEATLIITHKNNQDTCNQISKTQSVLIQMTVKYNHLHSQVKKYSTI